MRATPVERSEPPSGAGGVSERISEIAFGAVLRQELRYIAIVQRMPVGAPPEVAGALARLRDARFTRSRWSFLLKMRGLGHRAADRWLETDFASVGVRSTVDPHGFAHGPILREWGAGDEGSAA